jgi:peptide deformylase
MYGDPRLRTPPHPIKDDEFDGRLRAQLKGMRKQMRLYNGVGLAATQVNWFKRAFVWRYQNQSGEACNPQLVEVSEELEQGEPEGCLSIPGLRATVFRARAVTLQAQRADGEPFEMRAEGFVARIFQHEVDHLDGKLFIDRTRGLERARINEELRTFEIARTVHA